MAETGPVLSERSSIPKPVFLPSVCDDSITPDDASFSTSEDAMPIIDYSMLTSADPQQRSKAIRQLGHACQEYGFFSLINHGMPESLFERVFEGLFGFFDLPGEEKEEYSPKGPTDCIRWGRGYNPEDHGEVKREYLKHLRCHPKMQWLTKPPGLSDVMEEFYQGLSRVGLELLRGISVDLGLEEHYIEKALKVESGLDLVGANIYPAVVETDSLMGQPAHYDPGLLTLFIQNTPGGLQAQHNGKWLKANIPPNALFVNTGDHMEIFTNGKYKSLVHRVIVSNKIRRISTGNLIGLPLDLVVGPTPKLVDESHPPAYRALTYREYLEYYNYDPIDVKSCLTKIRL